MLDSLLKWSLNYRAPVFLCAALVVGGGIWAATSLSVDVFPDLAAPSVTILTDAHGLASADVERLVTYPLEAAAIGAQGVRRITSTSAYGMSVVHVDFEWNVDLFYARQIMGERMGAVEDDLPDGVSKPIMTPSSSIMGEIMLIGLSSDLLPPMEVRAIADVQVRRRLLGIPGVAQVVPIGGDVKEYQVVVSPERLRAYAVSLNMVMDALAESNIDGSGGVFSASGQQIQIRGIGRIRTLDDIRDAVLAYRGNAPVLVRDVATVELGPRPRYGTAAVDGQPALIMSVHKQPAANTLQVTRSVDEVLDELSSTLPSTVVIDRDVFRQETFIGNAVSNVVEAVRDGAILVVVILFLFLWSARATIISVLAIPFSLGVAFIVMKATGVTINTMTLGGIAIAIGALVDDAIIDVENVHRRLRENPYKTPIKMVFQASREVRIPIVYATLIICVVFVPFAFLEGFEGRMLQPLGFAFVISILASLLVAMTVTPALCYLLLPGTPLKEGAITRRVIAWYRPALHWSLRHPKAVMSGSLGLLVLTVGVMFTLNRGFLPPFQEGALVVHVETAPGTSLEESAELGSRVESILLAHPAVHGTSRRTGRGDLDDHLLPVSASEIDVLLDLSDYRSEDVVEELRDSVATVVGTLSTFGQPISHRIDHMLSGSRASLAVKLFGPDLAVLRQEALELESRLGHISNLSDVRVEPQVFVSQLRLYLNRQQMATYGVRAEQLIDYIEAGFGGAAVTQVRDGSAVYDVVVRFPEESRNSEAHIMQAQIQTEGGMLVDLGELVDLRWERGVNRIGREDAQRVLQLTANTVGGNAAATLGEVRHQADRLQLPAGYSYKIEGRITSANKAALRLGLFSVVAILLIFLILQHALVGAKLAALVMVNLPLALTGGVMTLLVTGTEMNLASMIGFLTLFGIAVRNGLLLVSQYQNLREQGLELNEAVIQGSLERVVPIMMTAITAALALLPLAIGGAEQGKEIQAPMAIVILGGLLTSTLLNMLVVPTLYKRYFPRPVVE